MSPKPKPTPTLELVSGATLTIAHGSGTDVAQDVPRDPGALSAFLHQVAVGVVRVTSIDGVKVDPDAVREQLEATR